MKNLIKILVVGLFVASIGSFVAGAENTNVLESFYVEPLESVDFQSGVMITQSEFTGVIVDYKQENSADDSIEFQMRFKDGLRFTEWVDLEPHHDHADQHEEIHGHHHHGFYDDLINTNLTNKYQYRVKIEAGPDSKAAELSNLKFTFINPEAGKTVETVVRNEALVAGFETNPNTKAKIISRSSWGANDELNYYSNGKDPDDDTDWYGDEGEIRTVVRTENGKDLIWPYQYADKIRTIVVHHTASTKDLDNPKQAIRNIHYFHAARRGWGDIGYNYIIDQEGNIYEGRKGGEKVVGGHAVPVNKTSIGISVLGNYQEQQVPGEVAESLVELISEKADRYDLDLTGTFSYKDKTYDVLQGHRDNSPTACPGENLYAALPSLRYIASNGGDYNLMNRSLAFVDTEPLRDTTELDAFDSETLEITLKNVGRSTWKRSSTFLRSFNYKNYSDMDIAGTTKMNEPTVPPGGNATFEIDLESGLVPGYKGLQFIASLNGDSLDEYPIFAPVFVEKPDLRFSVVSGDSQSLKMAPGERKTLEFELKNRGDVTWNTNGYQTVLAVKSGDTGLVSGDINVGRSKVSKNRTVDVSIPITAPSKAGTYEIELAPFIKNVGWFDGSEIDIKVKVSGKETKLSNAKKRYMESSGKVKVAVKETNTLEFELKNNSNHTWTNDSFGIAVLGGRRGLGTNDFSNKVIANAPVKPGQIAEIQMDIYPRAYSAFDYKLRVFANGKLLNRYGLDLNVVGSSTLQTSASGPRRFESTKLGSSSTSSSSSDSSVSIDNTDFGPDIRVHISNFDQDSVTVKGSSMKVKVDGSSKKSYSSAKVQKVGSKVKVAVGSTSYTGNTVRLENSGIITLDGYENRPSWNKSLNDNQFRETVEFRVVDGKLAAINELPMELYLRGLAEVSNSTNPEKIKTIMVAARSYAYHYVTDGEKFPGKPWNLDDSPARSQKYLGYGFEKRAPKIKDALAETAGKVVSYKGDVIKVPYFSQSDGKTKSAKSVWGWTNTPYLVSVDDPYCEGKTQLGHGVGISGCGSDAMANNGEDHEDIIKYYLKGVGFKYVYARS